MAPGELDIVNGARMANNFMTASPDSPSLPSPDWLALAGVALTAVLSFVMRELGGTAFFIAGAIVFWVGYVILRTRQDNEALHRWGFRNDNLRAAFVATSVVFIACSAGLAQFALVHGTLNWPLHLFAQLLFYPLWGLIQQFLALGIVASNLERLAVLRTRRLWLVIVTAVLFSAVHLYDMGLAAGTLVLELLILPLYLRYRNLWPLGILHGWLGALFYLWVLNEDLWSEIVDKARGMLGLGG